MATHLMKASWVLTLPLALALATPLARAADEKEPQRKAATKTVTTAKATEVKTVTEKAAKATEVKTPTRDVAAESAPDGASTVCHSIHDWQPSSLKRQTTSMETTPSVSRRERRRQRVATSERAVEVNP